MSLINDMLKNLDGRRALPEGVESDVVVVRKPPARGRLIAISLLVGLLVAMISLYLLDEVGLIRKSTPPPVVVSSPVTSTVLRDEPVSQPPSMVDQPRQAPEPATDPDPVIDAEPGPMFTKSSAIADMDWPETNEVVESEPVEQEPAAADRIAHRADETVLMMLARPANHYAVQLAALTDEDKIRQFAGSIGLDDPLYVSLESDGRVTYVLLLGTYPSYVAAATARDNWLSASGANVNTWVRPLGPLQEAMADINAVPLPGKGVSEKEILDDKERQIRDLLQQAEEALIQEKLTAPTGDNAYARYRQVLKLSPDHAEALDGIEQIVAQYLRLANEYVDAGNVERAAVLIERARFVDGDSARVTRLEHRIAAAGGAEVKPAAISKAKTESTKGAVVQRNHRKSEQEVLEEVANLQAEGALLAARNLMEQYLVTDPESQAVITALFRLNLHMDDAGMAAELLNSSAALDALTVLELSALLRVHEGELYAAIRMLEAVSPGYHETTYFSLRANLYQQVGRFSEAANIYRSLLIGEPDEGAFWLGLAVSLDSLKVNDEALQAFRKTRDSGQYDGEVLLYVNQRISDLSRR